MDDAGPVPLRRSRLGKAIRLTSLRAEEDSAISTTSNLGPTNTDNLQDSSGTEASGIRAVELVELSNGTLIMITSERGTSTDGISTYRIDNDPNSASYGRMLYADGTSNATATGTGDLSAKIDSVTDATTGAGYDRITDIVAKTFANGKTYVFTADTGKDAIGISEIGADGSLTPVTSVVSSATLDDLQGLSVVEVGGNPFLVAFAGGSSNNLLSFSINPATGGLTQTDRITDGSGTSENYLDAGWDSSNGFVESFTDSQGRTFVMTGSEEHGVALFTLDGTGNLTFQNARGDDKAGAGDTDPQGNSLGRDLLSPAETGLNNVDAMTFGEINGVTYVFAGGNDDDIVVFRIEPDTLGDGTFDLTLVGHIDNIVTDISALHFMRGANGEFFLAIGGGETNSLRFVEVSVNPATGIVTLVTGESVSIADGSEPGAEIQDVEDLAYHEGILVSASDNDSGVAVFSTMVCFCAGTLIRTQDGDRPVETLRPGDALLTLDHGAQPLRWIGSFEGDQSPASVPVRLRAGCLGPGLPDRDLRVSRQHRILVASPIIMREFGTQAVLIPAKDLCGLPGVELMPEAAPARFFHLLFDRHEVLVANGIPAESLLIADRADMFLSADQKSRLLVQFPLIRSHALVRQEVRGKPAQTIVRRHIKNRKALLSAWPDRSADPVRVRRGRRVGEACTI